VRCIGGPLGDTRSTPHAYATTRCASACTASPATPTDACRGTLLLKHGKRVVSSGPFTVPAGARQRVPVRLTRHGMRVARRAGWFLVDAEIPDGRIGPGGRGSSELTVKRR
jgi:hypothetical protein